MSAPDANAQPLNATAIFASFRYFALLFRLLWERHKSYLILILGVQALQGFLPVATLLVTQELINSIITGWQGGGLAPVLWLFGAFAAATLLKQVLTILQGYYETLFQTLIQNTINEKIMLKAITLGIADFENAQVQDQLKRAQQEAAYRPFQMFSQMMQVINGILTLVSTAMVLILWHWWAALLLVVLSASSFYSMMKLNREQFEVNWKRAPLHRESWYLSYLMTNDHASKEIKLFSLGPYFLNRFMKIYHGFLQEDRRMAKKRALLTLAFALVNLAATCGVVLLAVLEAFGQKLMIGNLYSSIQAVTMTQATSQQVISGVLSICQHNLYIEQLFVFLNMRAADSPQEHLQEAAAARESVERIEKVEFRDVTFRYPEQAEPALRKVSFSLRRGETLAVVGRNGSGKTTLIKLLTQMYHRFEGEILVNGRPVQEWDVASLQRRIGAVLQDFVRYEMPLRQNVGFGDIERIADDGKLLQAVERTGIDSLLRSFPAGLETQLGRWLTNGQQLSGGQWQRIAIARAFLREADLYVLDEPNSALDPIAENEVFMKLRELMRGRLGIFISHRFASARFADLILVMDGGEVVETGSHAELMEQDGLYAELYNLQMNTYQEQAAVGEE